MGASTEPYHVSKPLLDVLNELKLDYVVENKEGDQKIFLRTREFVYRQYEFFEIFRELVDHIYSRGHQDGFERGAYEAETKEDV